MKRETVLIKGRPEWTMQSVCCGQDRNKPYLRESPEAMRAMGRGFANQGSSHCSLHKHANCVPWVTRKEQLSLCYPFSFPLLERRWCKQSLL